jgi:hypothetical protein
MNRKEFLVQLTGYSALGAGLAAAPLAPCCAAAQKLSNASGAQPKLEEAFPVDKRFAWAQKWAGRMIDNIDAELDEPTRKRLMQAQGRTCYRGIINKQKFPPLDAFIVGANAWAGKEGPIARREGDTVYFDYFANPEGLRNADGWCLCALVQKPTDVISGTYCECSVGYVREMFTEIVGKPVQVELTESLKRGGKRCRFKIDLTARS